MNDLFLQLCASVAAAIEVAKPAIKTFFGLSDEDTQKPLYQASIRLLAVVLGFFGAVLYQCNITPDTVTIPPLLGYLLTGLLASLGSEVAHRVLEAIKAISLIFQNRAEQQTVAVTKQSSTSVTTTPAVQG